jgi:hypothetical protein
LLIAFSFFRVGLAGINDAQDLGALVVLTNSMSHQQHQGTVHHTEALQTKLAVLEKVLHHQQERIGEGACGRLKVSLGLDQVAGCLIRIPFKLD